MGQPDLDFTAPEVQTASNCSPMSDMFSLGLLIASLYNNGRSLVEANLSTSNYCKQLEAVSHIIFLCEYHFSIFISLEVYKDHKMQFSFS
jgi:hypothetical protein